MNKIKYLNFNIISIVLMLIIFSACKETQTLTPITDNGLELIVPKGFPQPVFPADNPYSKAKAELGRMLYYEKLLSKDSTIPSCSHCLKQEHAFSDNTSFSLGFDNAPEFRNTMSHQNLVYRSKLFWDGRGTKIELVAYRSMWLPYILNADTNEICKRLEGNPIYVAMFKKAFGEDVKISATLISKAIATFVRILITGDSPYDRYVNGDSTALTTSQIRGMKIFFSDRGNCSKCHKGFLFTDELFHNTGVTTHYFDRGVFEVTKLDKDRGKFLTPTIRNCEVTAPYMHNGELSTLEEVIDHYSRGGREIVLKDTLMKALNFTNIEKAELLSFLKALTDRNFLENPNFSNPNKIKTINF